jgi:hypothetical protein
MSNLFDPDTFTTAHARISDPVSSELTLASLGRDGSLRQLVIQAVWAWTCHDNTMSITDDDVLQWVEAHTGRRFQRNVLARTRGLLEEEGWLFRLPNVIGRTGRPTIAFGPTASTIQHMTQRS